MKRSVSKIIAAAMSTLLAGCSLFQQPPVLPDDLRARHSTGLPNAVVTNFNEALACMDDLMLINQVAPIYISSPPINNYTSDRSISSGATEMLITALAKMSIRSGGARYVSFGPEIQNVLSLQGAHPNNKDFRAPDFFIRGGLTQFNKTLWTGQRGAGVSAQFDPGEIVHGGTFFILRKQEDGTASISQDRAFGTLTMDLNAGFISNLQMIPGVASSNTLALQNREGKSVTGDLSVGGLGISYSFSDNISHDFNQVMRSLIEVGAIEIVGKLQGVPYWRCLSNAGTVEQRDQELRAKFMEQGAENDAALVRSAQTALKELKYYRGEISGKLDGATQEALQDYQRHMGLLATGLLNFETFRMLNIYTPARSGPYAQWWQNVNAVERGVVTPKVAPPTAPPPAAAPADAKAPAADAKTGPSQGKPHVETPFVLKAPTTLRALSREYFPHSGTVRSQFIRRVAAANPKVFPSIEAAFDQRLPAGQSLVIPGGLPAHGDKP